MALRIRKGDLVQIVAGADRGKQGRVISVDPARGKVRVEKVRLQKRHVRPGRRAAKTGGIVELEGHIDASNVMLVDPSSGKPDRVRVVAEKDEAARGGKRKPRRRRVRVFAKSGEKAPEPAAG